MTNNALYSITLSRQSEQSLATQLAEHLRQSILQGRIAAGAKLPASRVLAVELGVSRTTVLTAIEQLIAEGYATGRHGSGTFVVNGLTTPQPALKPVNQPVTEQALLEPVPFQPALPALDQFPMAKWARITQQIWRQSGIDMLSHAHPFGNADLRHEISRHLADWRGVAVDMRQIVITTGSGEAMELIAQTVMQPGQVAAVEDPGYRIMRQALSGAGIDLSAISVDENGLNPELLTTENAVVLTPSRHYPLGVTLPLSRRLRILAWAETQQALIIEDDYDSEFRYQGQPLPALMSLDEVGRVIYVGSFSKVLSPGLRLGFMVVPQRYVQAFETALWRQWPRASLFLQPVLAKFMKDGHLSSHIRKMRRLYQNRQQALVAALKQQLADFFIIEAEPSGMHLIAKLKPQCRLSDKQIAQMAADYAGLNVRALSDYYHGSDKQQGLVLGFAGFDETQLQDAVDQLSRIIKRA